MEDNILGKSKILSTEEPKKEVPVKIETENTVATIGVAPIGQLSKDSLIHLPVLKRDFKRIKEMIVKINSELDKQTPYSWWLGILIGLDGGAIYNLISSLLKIEKDKMDTIITPIIFGTLVIVFSFLALMNSRLKKQQNKQNQKDNDNILNELIKIEETIKDK